MNSGFRTYHEVDELRSDLPDQIAAGDERVSVRLASVARVIAVMSGKGGVGKSLVSALLATALARRGDRVGLIDADLNGPSVPRLLGIEPGSLAESPYGFAPPSSRSGVRVMSMAFVVEPDRALTWREPADAGFVWRGAQERGALREFLSDVAWGDLDVLLVDLPPGQVTRSDGYTRFSKAARLTMFQPHMHMLGKYQCLELIYPTQPVRTEVVNCAHFDYNWHLAYNYADDAAPLVPA